MKQRNTHVSAIGSQVRRRHCSGEIYYKGISPLKGIKKCKVTVEKEGHGGRRNGVAKNVSANNASSASILRTKDFIDSLTDTVRIILVFYTPQYGITSNVLITAKFHGSQGARVDYELLHYEIIEGTKLGLYIFVQSLVIFNLAAMLVEVINNLRTLYVEAKLGISISKAKLVTPVLDLLAFLLILVYVCLRIVDKAGAASTAEAILSDLDGIEWSSPQITLAFKKDRCCYLCVCLA